MNCYGISITEKLQEYITAIAKNHSISSYKHKTYRKILRGVGINTDCFIPSDWGIHVLESPVSLLREVIKKIIDDRLDYQENNAIEKFDEKNQIQIIDFRKNPDPRLKTPNEAWGKDWWKKWQKE